MGTRPLWLIAMQCCNRLEVFIIGSNVLPVFSFREEAQMFLGLGHAADSWQVKETTCGELVSCSTARAGRSNTWPSIRYRG